MSKFQPGQSGNPGGRPKGKTIVSTLLREILDEMAPDEDITYAKKMARAIVKKAADGDIRFITVLLERVEGKVTQAIEEVEEETAAPRIIIPGLND